MSIQSPQASYTKGWQSLTGRTLHRRSTVQAPVATEEEQPFIIIEMPPPEDTFAFHSAEPTSSEKTASASPSQHPDPKMAKVYEQILTKKAAVEKVLEQRAPWGKWLATIKQEAAPQRAYDLLKEKETSLLKLREQINAHAIRYVLMQWQKDQLLYPLKREEQGIDQILAECPDYVAPLYGSEDDKYADFWGLVDSIAQSEGYGFRFASFVPNTQLPAKQLSMEDQLEHDALEKKMETLNKNIKDMTAQYQREKDLFLTSKESFFEAHKQLLT